VFYLHEAEDLCSLILIVITEASLTPISGDKCAKGAINQHNTVEQQG